MFRSETPANDKIVGQAVYRHVRCGLVHEGLFRRKVNYSNVPSQPFLVTYPKKKPSGELGLTADAASIVLNPNRVYEGVKRFERYVGQLRAGNDTSITTSLRLACERLWGLGEGDNPVGMTEAQFRGETEKGA